MATNGNNGAQQTPRTELARTLLALADPIRLRMLNLMFAGALSPQQFAQVLGVDEKAVSRHLALFRDSRLVAWHTKNNIKHYTVRKQFECRHFGLLSLAIELLKDDSELRADIAVFSLHRTEYQHVQADTQAPQLTHFEAVCVGH